MQLQCSSSSTSYRNYNVSSSMASSGWTGHTHSYLADEMTVIVMLGHSYASLSEQQAPDKDFFQIHTTHVCPQNTYSILCSFIPIPLHNRPRPLPSSCPGRSLAYSSRPYLTAISALDRIVVSTAPLPLFVIQHTGISCRTTALDRLVHQNLVTASYALSVGYGAHGVS